MKSPKPFPPGINQVIQRWVNFFDTWLLTLSVEDRKNKYDVLCLDMKQWLRKLLNKRLSYFKKGRKYSSDQIWDGTIDEIKIKKRILYQCYKEYVIIIENVTKSNIQTP